MAGRPVEPVVGSGLGSLLSRTRWISWEGISKRPASPLAVSPFLLDLPTSLGLRGMRVHALPELLDHLSVERRDIVGLAARDEPVVHDDLLVDPVGAGVAQIGLEGRPRRHFTAS